ncbi:hypothetical protein GQ53DRAFT_818560 [Thozetella sp. PMI_491]|nr:hypothetical protein GQ53DRAFT_818560 [Thozetella sp. PMI_491]
MRFSLTLPIVASLASGLYAAVLPRDTEETSIMYPPPAPPNPVATVVQYDDGGCTSEPRTVNVPNPGVCAEFPTDQSTRSIQLTWLWFGCSLSVYDNAADCGEQAPPLDIFYKSDTNLKCYKSTHQRHLWYKVQCLIIRPIIDPLPEPVPVALAGAAATNANS